MLTPYLLRKSHLTPNDMDELAKKHCIFITSLGRTGTNFFGDKMADMIDDCRSLHEPDVLYVDPLLFQKIKEFGFFRMTLGKLLSRYSVRGLNIARQSGRLSDDEILPYLKDMRIRTLGNTKQSVYLEANCAWSSLPDLLSMAFPNSRIVYIVRDPRSWVSSWLNNSGARYSLFDVRSWFKYTRLTPYLINGDRYQDKWRDMTRFEKFCWFWTQENTYALARASLTDAVKIFRFEDLFNEEGDYSSFIHLFKFISDFPDGFKVRWNLKPELLNVKVNPSERKEFPEWRKWSEEEAKILFRHCGDLMEKFNYGKEPAWQKMINSV